MKKSKNAVYLIYPETAKVPANRLGHWDSDTAGHAGSASHSISDVPVENVLSGRRRPYLSASPAQPLASYSTAPPAGRRGPEG